MGKIYEGEYRIDRESIILDNIFSFIFQSISDYENFCENLFLIRIQGNSIEFKMPDLLCLKDVIYDY